MDTARVRSLAREILALSEPERQKLAREVLPAPFGTRAGLEEIDEAPRDLADDDLHALVERARRRASDLPGDEIAAIITEGLRAARAQGRHRHSAHPEDVTSAEGTLTAKIYEAWTPAASRSCSRLPSSTRSQNVVSRPDVRRRLRMTAVEAAALIEFLRRRSTVVTPRRADCPAAGILTTTGSSSAPWPGAPTTS